MSKNKSMNVSLPKEMVKRIERYVKQGRFESVDDFVEQASNLLLYAEDNKDLFNQALGN